jgi:hypothetical protein
MFKLVLASALIGLLAACSGMPGSSSAQAYWLGANPPRSAGEGPSFHPVYP